LSSGHWLLEVQVVAARAVADRARSEVTNRTIVEIMYEVVGMCQESNRCTTKGFKKGPQIKRVNCGKLLRGYKSTKGSEKEKSLAMDVKSQGGGKREGIERVQVKKRGNAITRLKQPRELSGGC
jgi:hypothetical protein